jgi:dihydroorotase
MAEGEISARLGLPGICTLSEVSEIAKIGSYVSEYQVPTVIANIFSKEGVSQFRQSTQKETLLCTLSLTHLLFCDDMCDGFNTAAKLYPPLGNGEDREALIALLKEQSVFALTSGDLIQNSTSKDQPFAEASFGNTLLDAFFPLLYTKLVKTEILDMATLIKLTATNPAKLLDKETLGAIKVGNRANFFLFDTKKTTEYMGNGVYPQEQLDGAIKAVWVDGVKQ